LRDLSVGELSGRGNVLLPPYTDHSSTTASTQNTAATFYLATRFVGRGIVRFWLSGEMSGSHAVCRPGLCNGPVDDDMTLYKPPFSRFVNHLSRRMLLIGVCVETRCIASCNKALKRDEQNSARLRPTHAANLSIRVGGLSLVLILHMHYFIRAHG